MQKNKATSKNKFISERSQEGINSVNWIGVYTLFKREVMRFLKIYLQTILGPALTTLLFLIIFSMALGRASKLVQDIPFLEFLAPGLIIMAMIQNAFGNTSSSLLSAKVAGNITDLLLPPLTAVEFASAFLAGAICRGLFVGAFVSLLVLFFVPLKIYNPFTLIYFSILSCSLMGLLGLITGIWASKFDHVAAITNFIVTPLSLLSGTFYSITILPKNFYLISQLNPFFYMIDGFRFSMIGYADSNIYLGGIILLVLNIFLYAVIIIMLKSGFKLKA
jgi:ABC-2 type transport system permease protein